MKIAVVHWLLNDVGGINSWTENFLLGLRRLGYDPQLYYGSHQYRLGCDPDRKVPRSRRWHLLPSMHLSYNDGMRSHSVKALNKYDLIVFAHPSPHPTKSSMSSDDPKGWQAFYTETKPFKICVFHDRHWDRTNAWIEDIRSSVGYAHAAQRHFLSAVKRFAGKTVPFGWSLFPLVVPNQCSEKKIRQFVLATQWLALKNHRFLIPYLNQLKLPLHSYGSGQTYHKLLPQMKQVYREDHHYDEPLAYNHDSKHIHHGHVEYRKVINAMSRCWFSLDLSIQGMTNMTHWEPLTVGTVSVMEERVQQDPHCKIPPDCCLTFALDNVLQDLNRIGRLPIALLRGIQQRGRKLVQECDCKLVAKRILRLAGVL